jgi:hypothetical protein
MLEKTTSSYFTHKTKCLKFFSSVLASSLVGLISYHIITKKYLNVLCQNHGFDLVISILFCINENISMSKTRDQKGTKLFQMEFIIFYIYKLKYNIMQIKLLLISSHFSHKKTFQFWKFFFMLIFLSPSDEIF